LHIKTLIKNSQRAILLIVTALMGMTQFAHSATNVSGTISSNTIWSLALSPYQVTADVTISNGSTLTIEAGVVVAFDANTSLTIGNGTLSARGTAGQPIILTSVLEITAGAPAPGDWGQVRFLDASNDSATILEYAQIRYGQGISVQAAAPTFNHLQITQNQGSAISIDLNSSPKGTGNQATGNTLNGISVPAGDLVGSITWGIKGIPYIVASGVISVGASPRITSISPSEIQQGQTIDVNINGSRLSGSDRIQFATPGISATLTSGNTDSVIPLRISTSASQPLGNIPFDVHTAAGWVPYTNGIKIIPLKPTIAVTGITPGSMQRAETKSFQINGNYLAGAQLTVPAGVGLSISNLFTTDTQAKFNLTTTTTAVLGLQAISVSNPSVANGTVAMLVNILDSLPQINTNSIPSAVLPDGVARSFQLSINHTDSVDHTFNLSTIDTSIISVTPASVTIPAGALAVNISIAGLQPGYTTLNISSPTLAAVSKQIYASSLPNGAIISPLLSPLVNVEIPYSYAQQANSVISPSITVETPVTVGSVLSVVSPSITVETPADQIGPVLSATITVIVP
jgi:hypothetical protein